MTLPKALPLFFDRDGNVIRVGDTVQAVGDLARVHSTGVVTSNPWRDHEQDGMRVRWGRKRRDSYTPCRSVIVIARKDSP